MIAVAIAVRLDSRGPALFRQRRVGYGEREFTVFKFRSMRLDADQERHRDYVSALISGERRPRRGGENLYKLAVDDRITPVGRRIRSWSLDELPQLFNVVLGDMTPGRSATGDPLRGRRVPDLVREALRRQARPDRPLAGQRPQPAHLRGNGPSLDIEYAERRSFLGDLSILARTPRAVLGQKGSSMNPQGRSARWWSATATGAPTSSATWSSSPEFRMMGLCEQDEGRIADFRRRHPGIWAEPRPRRGARRPADRGGRDRDPAPHPLRRSSAAPWKPASTSWSRSRSPAPPRRRPSWSRWPRSATWC